MDERPLSEMTNEEIELFITELRERRRNVSMKKLEERVEEREKKDLQRKKKDSFVGDSGMNDLLDDILKDI